MKIILSILLLGLLAVAVSARFDSSRCAHGPEYWCQHHNTAQECGAIQYCQDNVWSKIDDTVDMCTDCKDLLGDLQKQLENATTQALIVKDLKLICADLGPYASQCDALVSEYTPILLMMLVTLDPSTICSVIGFCPSGVNHAKELISNEVTPVNADTCEDCKIFFDDVKKLLSNSTDQDIIIKALKSACSGLGSFADQCNSYVDQYGKLLIDLLASELDSATICNAIGFCSGRTLKMTGDLCTDCEAIFGDVQKLLQNTTIQKEVLDQLQDLCVYLGELEAECKEFVQTYGPQVFAELATLLEPKTVCTELGVCSSQKKIVRMEDLILAKPIHSSKNILISKNTISAMVMKQAKPVRRIAQSTECSVCELLVSELDKVLTDNSTEAEIIKAVESVCKTLPSAFQTECDAIITQYGAALIELLVQKIQPGALCTELKLCTAKAMKVSASTECLICEFVMTELDSIISDNSTEQEILNALEMVCSLLPTTVQDECIQFIDTYAPEIFYLLQIISPDEVCAALGLCTSKVGAKILNASPQCLLCEYVMNELDGIITENSTEQEILDALDKVCTLLPASIQDDCTTLIETYGPEIFDLLKTITPDLVCTALGLCLGKQEVFQSASPECILCEYVLKELDEYLGENATEQEIIDGLDTVCSLLPSSISADCVVFVNKYGDEILQLLLMELDPVNVCKAISLCSASVSQVKKVTSDESCSLCRVIVQYADEYLEKDSTSQEIIQVLNSLCAVFGDYRSQCENIVLSYGAVIPELLAQILNPSQVCEELSLCPADKTMLGEKECTFGPSYWCASVDNAKECNAMEHCKNHVWN